MEQCKACPTDGTARIAVTIQATKDGETEGLVITLGPYCALHARAIEAYINQEGLKPYLFEAYTANMVEHGYTPHNKDLGVRVVAHDWKPANYTYSKKTGTCHVPRCNNTAEYLSLLIIPIKSEGVVDPDGPKKDATFKGQPFCSEHIIPACNIKNIMRADLLAAMFTVSQAGHVPDGSRAHVVAVPVDFDPQSAERSGVIITAELPKHQTMEELMQNLNDPRTAGAPRRRNVSNN